MLKVKGQELLAARMANSFLKFPKVFREIKKKNYKAKGKTLRIQRNLQPI